MSRNVRQAIGITEEIYKVRDNLITLLGEDGFREMFKAQKLHVLIELLKAVKDNPTENPIEALLKLLESCDNETRKTTYIAVVCEMLEPTLTKGEPLVL